MASQTARREPTSVQCAPSLRLNCLVMCLLALLCFFWLALETNRGDTNSFDSRIRAAVHGQSSLRNTEFMSHATQLGDIVALSFLSTGVILGFLFLRLKRAAALMAANMVGAWLLNDGFKAFFQRVRPEPFFGIPPPGDFSFPSGHSLCSFCFYGMVTALFVGRIRNRAARVVIVTAAAAIILSVGFSRVYLGVHHPSDVLGAWSLGLFWVSFLLLFDRRESPRIPDPADIDADLIRSSS